MFWVGFKLCRAAAYLRFVYQFCTLDIRTSVLIVVLTPLKYYFPAAKIGGVAISPTSTATVNGQWQINTVYQGAIIRRACRPVGYEPQAA